ncbi:uncharacterized protein LOC110391818 isoform X2 [Numida meleagris]|uniref:uncharacterized protein LOC110391818 isoform X2 n=1 Tax=Numida meleagris TaxID=8996 RepID=UPI000B3DB6D6|nr:uncharacterized protein LOC110391818 isoform X2 [Numida meleagris]
MTQIPLIREKEITPCSGNFSHLFLIPDDELGAPFPYSDLDPDFVPAGQPRGPPGQLAEQNPAHEPEGDARDVTGRDDPASRLSSGTETPADRVVPTGRALPGPWFLPVPERSWNPRGPEGGKDESQRGRYSQGSSHLLEELVKEMEKAARGADQQTAQKEALQEGSPPTRPALDNETQAVQATGMPGMNAGNTTAAVRTFQRQRYISAIAAASAVLLSALVLARVAVSWMWKKYVEGKREKKAAKRAHPDTDGKRVPTGGEGTVELGDGKRGLVPSDSLEEVSNDEIPVWERIPY